MIDKQIIIAGVDVSWCKYFCLNQTGNNCLNHNQGFSMNCNNNNCYYKQLKRKEQECEELKKDLHQNFKEKDKLHLIIDRLLEASGYDTNTASAEDFEDVYENMRYEKQQLDQFNADSEEALKQLEFVRTLNTVQEAEIKKLSKTLTEIKDIALGVRNYLNCPSPRDVRYEIDIILQKIGECEAGAGTDCGEAC